MDQWIVGQRITCICYSKTVLHISTSIFAVILNISMCMCLSALYCDIPWLTSTFPRWARLIFTPTFQSLITIIMINVFITTPTRRNLYWRPESIMPRQQAKQLAIPQLESSVARPLFVQGRYWLPCTRIAVCWAMQDSNWEWLTMWLAVCA